MAGDTHFCEQEAICFDWEVTNGATCLLAHFRLRMQTGQSSTLHTHGRSRTEDASLVPLQTHEALGCCSNHLWRWQQISWYCKYGLKHTQKSWRNLTGSGSSSYNWAWSHQTAFFSLPKLLCSMDGATAGCLAITRNQNAHSLPPRNSILGTGFLDILMSLFTAAWF